MLQNGSLFKEFEINRRFTADIKGSVVPDEMFGALKDILSAKGGRGINEGANIHIINYKL